jgi:hypothetical protein
MDPLTGDIYVYVHDVDVETFRAYSLNSDTFKVDDQAANVVPPRHRSVAQLQKWLDYVEAWFESPPAVVIRLHPKGEEDKHYDAMRPKMNPSVLHAYGLGCATGCDESLFHAREFLSTRASLFNKPDIGDNFMPPWRARTQLRG